MLHDPVSLALSRRDAQDHVIPRFVVPDLTAWLGRSLIAGTDCVVGVIRLYTCRVCCS